jgi:hypothetical protein
MKQITTIGLDLAKQVFQAHDAEAMAVLCLLKIPSCRDCTAALCCLGRRRGAIYYLVIVLRHIRAIIIHDAPWNYFNHRQIELLLQTPILPGEKSQALPSQRRSTLR